VLFRSFESGVSTIAQWIEIESLTGKVPKRFGNRYPILAPYELFRGKEGEFVIAVGNEDLWERLCEFLAIPGLKDDPRFRSNSERIKRGNRSALSKILQGFFLDKPAKEWVESLNAIGIPAGKINPVTALKADPQLLARGAFKQARHSKLGKVDVFMGLPKLPASPPSLRRASPALGEHTKQILLELGYTPREARDFTAQGAV
jgi:CoA:oxalate CoA-transferase